MALEVLVVLNRCHIGIRKNLMGAKTKIELPSINQLLDIGKGQVEVNSICVISAPYPKYSSPTIAQYHTQSYLALDETPSNVLTA